VEAAESLGEMPCFDRWGLVRRWGGDLALSDDERNDGVTCLQQRADAGGEEKKGILLQWAVSGTEVIGGR
jgi:hypothetical protein